MRDVLCPRCNLAIEGVTAGRDGVSVLMHPSCADAANDEALAASAAARAAARAAFIAGDPTEDDIRILLGGA